MIAIRISAIHDKDPEKGWVIQKAYSERQIDLMSIPATKIGEEILGMIDIARRERRALEEGEDENFKLPPPLEVTYDR